MILSIAAMVRAAWRLWTRSHALVLPITGLFVFVPQLAVMLLVPEAPRLDADTDATAWVPAFEAWVSANAWLYVGAALLVQFGTLATMALFLLPGVSVGAALRRAATFFPRYLLAVILVTLPLGVPMLALTRVPVLLPFALAALFYLLARTAMIGPVVLAEPGRGAAAAVVRSWRLTAGNGLRLATVIGGLLLAGSVVGSIVAGIDEGLRAGGIGNPVASAMIDAIASAATWASAVGIALVEAVAYRRLASRGT